MSNIELFNKSIINKKLLFYMVYTRGKYIFQWKGQVLEFLNNPSTGLRYTLGIHKGTKGGVAKYVKANQINRSLGTSRY